MQVYNVPGTHVLVLGVDYKSGTAYDWDSTFKKVSPSLEHHFLDDETRTPKTKAMYYSNLSHSHREKCWA